MPVTEALEVIDLLETRGILILGWEGWLQDVGGRMGHGSAPQGTVSLDAMTVTEAAQFCRETIRSDAARWNEEHPGTTDRLHICITVDA